MKIISWNVNGIRAAMKKDAEAALLGLEVDVICLQETKVNEGTRPDVLKETHPFQFWNYAEKKGYSGTAILSQTEPIGVIFGLGIEVHDTEGRVVIAEYADFYIVSVYTPNSQNALARLDYRIDGWDVAFREKMRELDAKKPVIFCGDLNVAHEEIDLRNPKTNQKNAGFTPQERLSLSQTLDAGFVDTFRAQHPGEPDHYSWWSYRAGARARNVGWRIDYVCCSVRLFPRVETSFIHPEIIGSDHCPVGITLK
ncbi:MAG: exodeoxyribonuclease III [Opitutales bacterium]|nr:exodeoxyribonuclease III [Opitutales bacterium]NRA26585.1 exodeoxyribonuclease III [Opitutales bacterium]